MFGWFLGMTTALKALVVGASVVVIGAAVAVPAVIASTAQLPSTAAPTGAGSQPALSTTPTPSDTPSPTASALATNAPQAAPAKVAPQPPGDFAVTSAALNWAEFAWSAPRSGGSAPITGYLFMQSTDGGNSWKSLGSTSQTTYRLENLPANTSRVYAVEATSSDGYSFISNQQTVTTGSYVPGAPTGFILGGRGSNASDWGAQFDVTAPVSASPITGYEVGYSVNGGATWAYTAATPKPAGFTNPGAWWTGNVPWAGGIQQSMPDLIVCVRALNTFGAGPCSAAVHFEAGH
jgi:hypothetical protein